MVSVSTVFKDAFGRENEELLQVLAYCTTMSFQLSFTSIIQTPTLTRQIFHGNFHELAHLLFRTSGLATSSEHDFI